MESDALVATPAVSRNGETIQELFADTERCLRAVQGAIDEAIERHRLLGEAIVVERDGRIIEIPADQIEPLASVRARRAAAGHATDGG